eukprot:IDg16430t1
MVARLKIDVVRTKRALAVFVGADSRHVRCAGRAHILARSQHSVANSGTEAVSMAGGRAVGCVAERRSSSGAARRMLAARCMLAARDFKLRHARGADPALRDGLQYSTPFRKRPRRESLADAALLGRFARVVQYRVVQRGEVGTTAAVRCKCGTTVAFTAVDDRSCALTRR